MTNPVRQAVGDDSSTAKSDEYQFYVVTSRELDSLAVRHPVLAQGGAPFGPAAFADAPTFEWDYPCFFYLTDPEGSLAAYTRAFPDELSAQGERYPWAWTGDLYTAPKFRGRGVATQLQRRSTAWLHQRAIGRGSVFSIDTTLHIYRKIGSTVVGYAPRYLTLKTARPLLAAHLPQGWDRPLGRLTQPLIRATARAKWTLARTLRRTSRRSLRCLEWTHTDALPNKFPHAEKTLPFQLDERPEHLAWKMRLANAQRTNECQLYLLMDAQDVPQAFLVTRLKQQKTPLAGKYQDFELFTLMHYGLFRHDPALYAAIVDATLKLFWQSRAEVLEVIASEPPLVAELKRFGLLRVGRGMSFTVALPTLWGELPEWEQLANWPLTHFRGDAFSF